jgi:phosphatidate cytidylyltransferase
MSPLLSRFLVTLVGLPLVLWLVWLGGWWLAGLALVASLIALHELYVMARSLRPLVLAGYAGAILALVGAQAGGMEWMVGGALATLPLAFVLYGVADTRQSATVAIGTTVLGVVWIPLALGHLVLLRGLPEHGRLAVFTVLLVIFADSSAAYMVGRFVGRHRLAPAISPGKTVEGFVAGALAAVAVAFFTLYEERDVFLAIWQALLLGAILAAAELLGDLFESAFKRDLHVKDSGRLLAGHGGMLDRIDSLLFAGPAAFYAIAAFGYG